MTDVMAVLQAAIAAHGRGDLAAAAAGYRAVLEKEPTQGTAAYLLGMAVLASGRHAEALGLLRTAARLRAEDASVWANLAHAAVECGAFAEAEAAARAALALRPGLAAASIALGRALLGQAQAAASVAAFGGADRADALWPVALVGRAMAWLHARAPTEALADAEAALAAAPGLAEAHYVRGTALAALRRAPEAVAALGTAVRLAPGHARAWANLGNAALDADDTAAALRHLQHAVTLAPDLAEAHASLGFALAGAGRLYEAVAACDAAIALRPDFAEAHWNRSFANLLAGRFGPGWEEYEWRKRHDRFARDFLSLPGPEWAGEDLAGRHLLVQAEQGLGDTIQFARYLPLLAARAARVTLVCPPPLRRLLAQLPIHLLPRGESLPAYDLWVDQMSLPRLFGTTPETIPSPTSYLSADPALTARWRARIGPARIGLVWAGNPAHSNDHRRSMPATALAPIVAGAPQRFVSLQVGPSSGAMQALRDWSAELTDFAETAALISVLDLVIAVDTSTAHLAGALGKPVWLMLPHAPDWRWMHGRADSPWYAAARLFRQPRAGDWGAVVAEISAALAAQPRAAA